MIMTIILSELALFVYKVDKSQYYNIMQSVFVVRLDIRQCVLIMFNKYLRQGKLILCTAQRSGKIGVYRCF